MGGPISCSSSGSTKRASESSLAAFSRAMTACSSKASAYGACVKARIPEVEKGMCSQEFEAFKQCFSVKLASIKKGAR
ncbi:hypothetical protein DUNSADRAFT_7937 [Dunaliella salina]|uniref:Uncharacterized protein n=1 Tax=Dunaliella salina TaxID=3046 RepID=A0ABQ7H5Z8_DUNSA|nr:hypothetical protein DUNSADRAFT_7937 [Dunaliella salina]|eukprot:KAF5842284.1 hypothetical protein DUNSADRAFT_7937 [Dunaliella salina]